MEENLLKILNDIIGNIGLKKFEKIENHTRLREDLGLDSFQLAELTVHIEEEYGVDVFEDGLVNTIGEIKDKILTTNG